jgi:hypothetical protein
MDLAHVVISLSNSCDYGQGKYSVLAELGGKETVLVDSNGQYGAVDINTFVVLDGPASKRRVVTVEIDLDSQPQEIGWSIQRDNSLGGVLASRSIGTYTNERGLKTEKISIEDGLDGTLSFIVVDANGNGGPKYKVLYDDVVVVEGDGNFGLTAVHMINADDLRSRDSILSASVSNRMQEVEPRASSGHCLWARTISVFVSISTLLGLL